MMLHKAALTLLASVIAMNTCYAMENEREDNKEKRPRFFKTISDKFSKKSKKKKTLRTWKLLKKKL